MLGAITGDIIGSLYEHNNVKSEAFELFSPFSIFTDDTVLTIAIAHALLTGNQFSVSLKQFGRAYPRRGYGADFQRWLDSPGNMPYNSWGNGSAMRASPVAYVAVTEEQCLYLARQSAEVTHNHPQGILGAQAVALSIFLARKGHPKSYIRKRIEALTAYDLSDSIERIRPNYQFDVSCNGSVPHSIIAFLDSSSFEDAIRKAISIGGDSDTIACMTGSIAEAYYGGVPVNIINEVLSRLPDRFIKVIHEFSDKYN